MKITAITKFKQGELYEALKQLGWSQSELARRVRISVGTVGEMINLKRRPSPMVINRIQKAFGEAGIYIDILAVWPSEFKGFGKISTVVQTKEIELDRLLYAQSVLELEQRNANSNTIEELDRILNNTTLSERERSVVRQRFFEDKSLADIKALNELNRKSSRSTNEQVVAKALRKLRSPLNIHKFFETREICAENNRL